MNDFLSESSILTLVTEWKLGNSLKMAINLCSVVYLSQYTFKFSIRPPIPVNYLSISFDTTIIDVNTIS